MPPKQAKAKAKAKPKGKADVQSPASDVSPVRKAIQTQLNFAPIARPPQASKVDRSDDKNIDSAQPESAPLNSVPESQDLQYTVKATSPTKRQKVGKRTTKSQDQKTSDVAAADEREIVQVVDDSDKEKAAQLPCPLCSAEDKSNSALWQSAPEKLRVLAGFDKEEKFVCSRCGQDIRNHTNRAIPKVNSFDAIGDAEVEAFIQVHRELSGTTERWRSTTGMNKDIWRTRHGDDCVTCGMTVKDISGHRQGLGSPGFGVYTCQRCIILLNEYEQQDEEKRRAWITSRMALVKNAKNQKLDPSFLLRYELEHAQLVILTQEGFCPTCAERVQESKKEGKGRDRTWMSCGSDLRICQKCSSTRGHQVRNLAISDDDKEKRKHRWVQAEIKNFKSLSGTRKKNQREQLILDITKAGNLSDLDWLELLLVEQMAIKRNMLVGNPLSREEVHAGILASFQDEAEELKQKQKVGFFERRS